MKIICLLIFGCAESSLREQAFSSCGSWFWGVGVTSLVAGTGCRCSDSVVVAHGFSCSAACGVFLNQEHTSSALAGEFSPAVPPEESTADVLIRVCNWETTHGQGNEHYCPQSSCNLWESLLPASPRPSAFPWQPLSSQINWYFLEFFINGIMKHVLFLVTYGIQQNYSEVCSCCCCV